MLVEQVLKRGAEVSLGDLPSLRRWFPVALDVAPLTLWWRYLGEHRFVEPFFQDSFALQDRQGRKVCRTPLCALEEFADGVAPTAFIFHVSRCGSTLITQMLASLPSCIVISEPPVLDAFFRLHHHQPARSGGIGTLRSLVAALGQRRSAEERHLFVKFDSWHMPWMPLVRQAFPETPIVLLYRDPVQVLASHRLQRGPQMVPGMVDTSLLRADASAIAPSDLDGYASKVLDAIFSEALRALHGVCP
ncbi:MAG: hypothetical protein EOO54_20070, partial [Haliea sp.]